jgi:hypothetical protein
VNVGSQFAQCPPDAGGRSVGSWHFAIFISLYTF